MKFWLSDAIRDFFFTLDSVVYWFITIVYQLIMDVSRASMAGTTIDLLATRIYALLGVFILFKLIFTFLSMLVNPDIMTDKEQGAGKVVTRVIIVLVLIISVPLIFKTAYRIQGLVIEDNTIGRILLGITSESRGAASAGDSIQNKAGKEMSFHIFKPFFEIKPSGVLEDGSAIKMFYESAENEMDIRYYGSIITVKHNFSDGEDYLFDYSLFISTVTGVIVVILLVGMAIDVGVRVVKLGFLQLIAPIPIASYVDPKSSKDGPFSKWVQECVSTYLSLFLRLIIIFFVVFIISELTGTGFRDITDETRVIEGAWVKLFIIFGALMFAKQAPKLIEELFGIKGTGEFNINPLTKLKQIPGVGMAGSTAAGAIGGAITGAVTGGWAGAAAGLLQGGAAGAKSVPFMGLDEKGKGGSGMGGLKSGSTAVLQAATGDEKAQAGFGAWFNRKTSGAVAGAAASKAHLQDAKDDVDNAEFRMQRYEGQYKDIQIEMSRLDTERSIVAQQYGANSTEYRAADANYNAAIAREKHMRATVEGAKENLEKKKKQLEALKKQIPGKPRKTTYRAGAGGPGSGTP